MCEAWLGWLFCHFPATKKKHLKNKSKDQDETINLIEKQVVERDQVAKYFIDLDDL
jgi:hypothetical protein